MIADWRREKGSGAIWVSTGSYRASLVGEELDEVTELQ